ncbi:BRO-N domain-containing protein [Litoreibacter albidus]|uniref:BRO-N domain-containing protein n=1 Tax=Litoreibacter albidus TaxID=670155 RepID=UPI00373642B7
MPKPSTAPEISTFKFHNIELRTILIDGEPWFVGSDVSKAMEIKQVAHAYRRLDETERTYVGRTNLGMKPGRPLIAVNESGLYKLVMRSD